MSLLKIIVVDDNEAVRNTVRSLLASPKECTVCGEARDGLEAIEKAKLLRPDLILMDVSMPRMDGLEATRVIQHELPETKVIIVSQNDPAVVSQQAAEVKAHGYIEKADLRRKLIPAIQQIFPNHDLRHSMQPAKSTQGMPWLVGDEEMATIMRSTDWSKTVIGPPDSWSPALRMMSQFLLSNRFPQLLWWGPQFCSLYNDAYVPILGKKHPWALGQPVQEVWHEIWHVLKPLIETPFRGGPATWMEDIPLEINRRGFVEETHFTIAYSPVPDETVPSGIGGVLATVHEITGKVIGERRVVALQELGARSVEPKSAEEACTIAAETLARHSKDVPFVLLYLLDAKQESAYLAGNAGIDIDISGSAKKIDLSSKATEQQWPFSQTIATEEIQLARNLDARLQFVPQGPWSDAPSTAAVIPVRSNIPHQLAGFLVVGISARIQFDQSYRNFLELMSTQVATTIANARAYEEERKRAEALAEIDRAKTIFFSNVSHEFRTPLTLMLGPIEDSLAEPDRLPAEHFERLQVVYRNSRRLLKLVNTLLDFSRLESGRIQACYEPIDVANFTTELASVFRSTIERAGLKFVINCPQISEPVYLDREMWEKIVFNLLSNAFKFTFAGEIEISLRAVNKTAELTVRDTGTGIPPQDLPHLFERFYRVKNAYGRTFEGSGIGLALIQELTKLHGGTVCVESELKRGSAFTVAIPLGKVHLPVDRIGAERTLESTGARGEVFVQEALRWLPVEQRVSKELQSASPHNSQKPIQSPTVKTKQRPRILLADDNADMRDYVQRLLSEEYEVEAVVDGEAALNAARKRRPDLIVSDIMMPRLDGFGILQAVRADNSLKSIPTILLSARAGEEARIQGLSSGADDYIVKPFSARELLARVKSHLAIAQVRGEVTELENKLRLDTERLAAIVACSDDAIISKNLDGVITTWNQGAERIFGYTAEEAIGQPITLIIPANRRDEEVEILARLRRGEIVDHFQTVRMRKDGTTLDISVTISPLKDSTGRIIGAAKVARDISKQKQAEQVLRESEERYRKLAKSLDTEVRARTNELEVRNADVLQQSAQLRDLSRRLLQAQEDERRHIARELHDSAGQTLTVLGMNLAHLGQDVQDLSPEVAKQVQDSEALVQQLHQEIRTTSYLLHPPLLEESGLLSALSWYIQGLSERSKLNIQLTISEDFGRLPDDMELLVFRVVQECLTNIHRHSGSKTVSIQLARTEDAVTVDIQDQGHGMSPAKLAEVNSHSAGLGIRGMRERLRQFDGSMNIESDSSGTRVSVTIPLESTGEHQGTRPVEVLI